MAKILLQTTIVSQPDDWTIDRFSRLRRTLIDAGHDVVGRDKEPGADGDDPLLLALPESDFDQLWLFAVDTGDGISARECDAMTRFRTAGRGILVTRDHQDLGSSVCTIGGVGAAHHFHSSNQEPDDSRHQRDDRSSPGIDWPNYHSGANGDYQRITIAGAPHELLLRGNGSAIESFPAHPHEGAVGAPADDPTARVIATGCSRTTNRDFNLIVIFDGSDGAGRAIAESSFHHLCDYNWDPRDGCPTFVDNVPGREVLDDPARLEDVKTYVRNVARWLS